MVNSLIATGQHILCSSRFGWETGTSHDGFQILLGACAGHQVTLRFAPEGGLIEILTVTPSDPSESPIVQARAIRLLEFAAEALPISLTKLPHDLQHFLDEAWDYDASERAHYAGVISRWKERHHYVFRWDTREFWCDKEGKIVTYQNI